VPTVGNVISWDNPYRSFAAWPDVITCWSEETKEDCATMCAHPAGRIRVVGAPQFDAYCSDDFLWPKEKLCSKLGLDPARPIILYATLGQGLPFVDETGTFAAYLEAVDRGLIEQNPQTVLRLHPLSRLPYFESLIDRDDVVVSRFTGYLPGMMWAPSRDEIVLAGNLLAHAAVCVSPGSTMTIEAAIFDTPTVMPAFNPLTGEEYKKFFEIVWLKRHFRRLIEEDLIPVANSTAELVGAINTALHNPAWYRDQRVSLRDTILGPLDGRSTERLAGVVVSAGRIRGGGSGQ
jgi:CDP-glycerol glycerophosphotransferase (TagB/SpsB family)